MTDIDPVYTCLIGDPVQHSVSDTMYKHFSKLVGIDNYQHLKFRVLSTNPEYLGKSLSAISALSIRGANITLPYKELCIPFIDSLDNSAKTVGAVNTVVNNAGVLVGYNTDGVGAIKAIEYKLRKISGNDSVVIFGAGGASRAIIGSFPAVKQITVINRSVDTDRIIKLEHDFRSLKQTIVVRQLNYSNVLNALAEASIVINATPLGMFPNIQSSIISDGQLSSLGKPAICKKIFFDAVFNPYETLFIKLAKKYGAETCPGIFMMLYQGVSAFNIWTGKSVPDIALDEIAKKLINKIKLYYHQ